MKIKPKMKMMIVSEYVIHFDTVLFVPFFDEYGNHYTIVIEKDGCLQVNMSPLKLIDYNLRYYGYSFRGAIEGARMILGNISMKPIIVNSSLGLYWFPTTSPSRDDCIWIASHHVAKTKRMTKDKTKIKFNNGGTLTINMTEYTFDQRLLRAYKLKYHVEERTKAQVCHVFEEKTSYDIFKKSDTDQYEVMEVERE